MNHFEVFGLRPTVDVDVKALEQRHRELSLEFHPDRLTQADAHTRRVALEKTTALNDAVKVLKDRARRAVYVLKLMGVDLDAEGENAPALPLDFLQEIMERREQLEAVKEKHDLARAQAMAREVSRLKDEALTMGEGALRRNDPKTAATQLGRMRYFTRFVEEVEALEEELEP